MISLVQETGGNDWGASLSLPFTTSAGSLLVAQVNQDPTAGTITDSAGNTYSLLADTTDYGAIDQHAGQLYYCLNASPATSVTLTRTGNSNIVMRLTEWSGVGTLVGGGAARSASPPPRTVETNDLVILSNFRWNSNGTGLAAPTGYTALTTYNRGTITNSGAYKIATANGTEAPTYGSSSTNGVISAAFGPATGGEALAGNYFRLVGGVWTAQASEILREA